MERLLTNDRNRSIVFSLSYFLLLLISMICVLSILLEAIFLLRKIINAAPPHTIMTMITMVAIFTELSLDCPVKEEDVSGTVDTSLDSDTVY